jgi:hypothetical protein
LLLFKKRFNPFTKVSARRYRLFDQGTVRVEMADGDVRPLQGKYPDLTVRPHAGVAVTHGDGKPGNLLHQGRPVAVHHDEIIPQSIHLGEFHFRSFPPVSDKLTFIFSSKSSEKVRHDSVISM